MLKEVFYMRLASAFDIGPRLCKLRNQYDFIITPKYFCFSMEKCTNVEKKTITELEKDSLKERLLKLHQLRIGHRDIKLNNLMMNHKGEILFVDFGGS